MSFNPEQELKQIKESVRGEPAKTNMYLDLIARLLMDQVKGVQEEEKKPGEVQNGSKVTRKR